MQSGQLQPVEFPTDSMMNVNTSEDLPQDKLSLTEKLRALLSGTEFTKESIEPAMNLVRKGADPNVVNDAGFCLLHCLAFFDVEGSYSMLIEELVVKYHANVNIANKAGHTPIRICYGGELGTIRQLIKLGAKDKRGNPLLPLLEDKDLTYEKVSLACRIQQPYLIDFSFFKKKEYLGGCNINQYVYQYETKDGEVAVKEFRRDTDNEDKDGHNRGSFVNEAIIMRRLTEYKAENVIRFLGFNLDAQSYKIVMEYAPYGSLFSFIIHNPFSSNNKSAFICGVINGLKHIHQYQIMHCDFKSGNILVDSTLQIKVADFGSSHYTDYLGKTVTTYTHRAPELKASPYTQKSDIFSLGIVMWEVTHWVVTERCLFRGESSEEISDYYQSGKRPHLSKKLKGYAALIKRCWDQDPQKRPTAEEAQKELHEQKLCECRMKV